MLCRGCRSPRAELGPNRAGASLTEGHAQTSCRFPQAQTGSNAKGKSSGSSRTLFPSSVPASAGWDADAERLSPGDRTILLVVGHPQPRDPAVPQSLVPGAYIINTRTNQRYESEPCGERLSSQDGCRCAVPLRCATVLSLLGLSS